MRSFKPIVLIVPNMSKDFSGIFFYLYSPDTELKCLLTNPYCNLKKRDAMSFGRR